MKKILGLDLGTNSIGWALIEKSGSDNGRIIDIGVRIFPEGVDNLGEGENELSKNASRRGARQVRRQGFRRKLRKKMLMEVLSKHNMCPLTQEDIQAWKKKGQFPDTPELTEWFKVNPYELRSRAVQERISLSEFGRVLYHMAQRRGFLSNSRSTGADEKEDGKLFFGDTKEGKAGINETQQLVQEYGTLGKGLASHLSKENGTYRIGNGRIRNRYTARKMYVNEFEAIWQKQESHHKELNAELKELIGGRKKDGYKKDGIIFYQRPLRSQKFLIGKCSIEPKKPRCPISAIPFELYRAYQFINGIECDGQKLSKEERELALEVLLSNEKPKFSRIRRKLKKIDEGFRFNYQNDDTCPGTYTISQLSNKKFFGQSWFELSEKEQEDIWHALFFFEDKDKLKQYAIEKWEFDEEKAMAISKFNLKDGYASLSRKAVNNILPFLKMGFVYDVATALGGVKNAFGETWEKLYNQNKDFIFSNVPEIVRTGRQGGYIEDLKEMLRNEFGFDSKKMKKLYHHSVAIHRDNVVPKLPLGREADREIMAIRNPIVTQALFELRKLVNCIIDQHDNIDEIKIELARDLKISKKRRWEIRLEQTKLEQVNDYIIRRLREHGQPISHENILKYKLWEECEHTCPFCGKQISVEQLFNGNVQIEHIFPWSKSLDDSFMNKTLCHADENRAKRDRTPYQYFTEDFGEKKWEEVKANMLKIFYDTRQLPNKYFPNRYKKYKRFIAEKFDSDFVQRQLNDTRYISREARAYLLKICEKVNVAPGQMTANLRHKWGLNSLIGGDDYKERTDHRHHAIDALVMACFNVKHLNEISKWNRYNRYYELKDFPMPWDGFHEEAKRAVENILISHKRQKRVLTVRNFKTKKNGKEYTNNGVAARGQLHKESVYGRRTPPDGKTAYHIRKPLDGIASKTHVDKIVDPVIRKLIEERIDELGGYNGKSVPKGAFFDIDESGERIPKVFLPNRKGGDSVPVYKVRIRETINGAEVLKEDQNKHVNPQKNHHVIIYEKYDGSLKEQVVSFWTAVERKKQGQPLFQLPEDGRQILTAMQINDMFLLGWDEEDIDWENVQPRVLCKNLYKVQKLAGGDYFFELCFRMHTDSRMDKDAKPDYIYIKNFGDGKTGWMTHKPIKVTITPTGKIEKL